MASAGNSNRSWFGIIIIFGGVLIPKCRIIIFDGVLLLSFPPSLFFLCIAVLGDEGGGGGGLAIHLRLEHRVTFSSRNHGDGRCSKKYQNSNLCVKLSNSNPKFIQYTQLRSKYVRSECRTKDTQIQTPRQIQLYSIVYIQVLASQACDKGRAACLREASVRLPWTLLDRVMILIS